MLKSQASLDALCVNTIRTLAADAIEQANSGHPGLPLGAAPMAYVLWQRHLKHAPGDPAWFDRDRFVLSPGHGSALLYALLHLYGYDLPLEEVRNFRQWGSKTPGHPEFGLTAGVEATTGPLGQGTANAVGMAMAERFLAQRYNRPGHQIVDHFTYALVSDGDLMEGISQEAASLAGHLGLGKLIYLYDSNDITLDGAASLHFTEDVAARYASNGWHVETIENGDTDLDAIDEALQRARAEEARPSLLIVKTTIGYGSPAKAGTAACHGAPLGTDELAATKKQLGWEAEAPFTIPVDARDGFRDSLASGAAEREAWLQRFASWKDAHPDLAREFELALAGELPEDWEADLPSFEVGAKVATRAAGGKVLNGLAKRVPWMFGGDADLSCSTKTALADESSFDGRTGAGRNVHFGVREHAMGAIANGVAYHGGARIFCSTFFVFSDYMRPSMRLAAMNHLPVSFVFTHDSVAVGEDGPTHQPIEHLASLRAMPGLVVLRPCDGPETTEAWRRMLLENRRPCCLVLSRQGLPTLDRSTHAPADGLHRGAYVLSDSQDPRAILIATGAEVHVALRAQKELQAQGIETRVVSMPSWELFEDQDAAWKEAVLPASISARVSIEAGATFGWERYLGREGVAVGIDRYGASAPGDFVLEQLGMTSDRVVRTVRTMLGNEVLR